MDSIQLLNQLASAGRVGGLGASGAGAAAPSLEGSDFATLLRQAQTGGVSSRLSVSVRSDAGVTLSQEQLDRLALAADRAEAAGVRNALVLIDGKRLIMDVQSREVVGVAAGENGVVSGVDGVVDMGNSGAAGVEVAPGGPGNLPGAAFSMNASLARLLRASAGTE